MGLTFKILVFFPWEPFSDYDLEVLEGSLRDTISKIQPAQGGLSENEIYLHLLVRRYFLVCSNSGAGILAAVSWHAADGDSKPIFQELFYADFYSGPSFLRTIGRQKDSVNEKILRRTIQSSIANATSGRNSNDMSFSTQGTLLYAMVFGDLYDRMDLDTGTRRSLLGGIYSSDGHPVKWIQTPPKYK